MLTQFFQWNIRIIGIMLRIFDDSSNSSNLLIHLILEDSNNENSNTGIFGLFDFALA